MPSRQREPLCVEGASTSYVIGDDDQLFTVGDAAKPEEFKWAESSAVCHGERRSANCLKEVSEARRN
jgi:hypothetical protein